MKRLLAAVGLAVVACLALVLAACTETTSLDNPLLETRTVSGTVYWGNTDNTVSCAKVIIWYTDGTVWFWAKEWQGGVWYPEVYTNQSGQYGVEYCYDAKNAEGKVVAEKTVGETTYTGVTYFTYPNGISTVQDVRIYPE